MSMKDAIILELHRIKPMLADGRCDIRQILRAGALVKTLRQNGVEDSELFQILRGTANSTGRSASLTG